MKNAFLLLPIFLLLGCIERPPEFKHVECNTENTNSNGNLRKVFKPCREYIFTAQYWDQDYNLISSERIWMMATGNGWKVQPELQDEIIIQYAFDSAKMDEIEKFNINPEVMHWSREEVTGIIEDVGRTWMHPFRSNQYLFTQVAPFPEVMLPLKLGVVWNSSLRIHDGWGLWAHSTLEDNYEVVDFEVVQLEFGDFDAWHIRAITTAEFGTSVHDFWYNEEYGFIKMFIKNYAGQILQLQLSEVKEPK